jgi:hypothetical protein
MFLEAVVASIVTPAALVAALVASISSRSTSERGPALGVQALLASVSAAVSLLCCLNTAPAHSTLLVVVLGLTLAQGTLPITLSLASRGCSRVVSATASLCVIVCAGLALVLATTSAGLILAFEIMLFGALCLLRVTAKAERGVEALTEMYLWSVAGSFALVSSL